MKLEITGKDKHQIFAQVADYLAGKGIKIVSRDESRPWGGFFVIDESQAAAFVSLFFPDENLADLYLSARVSPKILMVQPHTRLSWQYHHRRAEIWRVIGGKAGVVTSDTDEQGSLHELKNGDKVKLVQGQRHRLVGLDGWGVIAEIWQHTDAANPSDENDIVRVQDDFGR